MAGDYTKFTFNPHKDYSGVLKQQGRVDLDADWNELIEIIDRRWRAETMDIIGRAVVPLATTPDAFLITPTGLGTFNIGIGRMYVDGLQPECHGIAPQAYDATLGEQVGTLPVPYGNQPYFPSLLPPPPISTSAGKIDLVFLDVWQREITAIEDPKIQEIALGGPDTDTRVQTAWQVRVLQRVDRSGCSDRIPAWDALTAPSAGRLTTAAVAPPASEDECVISPSGGYKGLENRLYRVEIHTPGTIGGATPARFKWSRDNASIASAVETISAGRDQITVKRIGRDPVLRFRVGDWIEVLDDHSEFNQQPGQMVNVTQIDEANRILTVAPALPIGAFDAGNPGRHTRVRRWDQRTGVSPATGLLDVTAGPIQVEDGIQITFGLAPAAGNFRVGDYWVFAARTADGSVEVLQNAPPRGILHHYCRLGFITWGATLAATKFDDCRQFWPPACCGGGCTVTVGDGIDSHGDFSDLQAAIDSLGPPGGVVCIGRGVFPITQAVHLSGKRNVIIRGAGAATRILFNPTDQNQNLFEIQRADHITIEALFAASTRANALVRISESSFCTVRECTLVNLNLADPGHDKLSHSGRAIEFNLTSVNCIIRDNVLLAPKGMVSAGEEDDVRDLQIRGNRTLCRQVAILLREATGLQIFHNQLRGLNLEKWGALAGPELSRSNVNAVQNQVTEAFAAATSVQELQAAGILLFSGRHVVIRDNWIAAQVGIVPFLLLDGSISGNQIFALISILLIYGVVVRISDNLLLGLLAGLLHAGILANLNCGENTFIGFNGITTMSLSELLLVVGPILVLAWGSSGITSAADAILVDFLGEAKVDLKAFGLALALKIHRNVFLSFEAGISKSEHVISADVSVIDNTFAVCRQLGILFGSEKKGSLPFAALNFRHLIQANAFQVTGRAIVSDCALTEIHGNSIFCDAVAIELSGESSHVQGNFITGRRAEEPVGEGLITVHPGARLLKIVDNRLVRGPGYGILLEERIEGLTIERNSIQSMAGNGISTATESGLARDVDIIGNHIEACRGDGWHRGAIVLGKAIGLRVSGNVLVNNTRINGAPAHGIYVDEAVNAEINGNVITANVPLGNAAGTQNGAICLHLAFGDVRVQNNAVRDNGGSALMIGAGEGAQEYRLLVQNNYFSSDLRTGAIIILMGAQSAHYQGNQSFQTSVPFYLPSVDIRAVQAIVTGNTVQCGGIWAKLQITALGTLAVRCAVVTSNLVSGGPSAAFYNPSRLSMAHNLNL